MALARTCVHHPLGFDLQNLLGAHLRPDRHPEAGEHEVAAFEAAFADFVGSRHAIAFAYARSAVHFTLQQLDLAPGTEVVMPPITIEPMVDAVVSLGLVPRFVDLDPETLIFDLAALEAAVTPRTGAALLTYLFGIAADPRPVIAACRAQGVFVIEDFSHNLGATVAGRCHGTFGDVGVYSCSPTKTLDAYGGGVAVTDDDGAAANLRSIQRTLPQPPPDRLPPRMRRDLVWNLATRKPVWTAVGFPALRILRRWAPALERSVSGRQSHREVGGALRPDAFERFAPRQARAALRMLPTVSLGNATRRSNARQIETALRHVGAHFPRGCDQGESVYWQAVVDVDDPASVQQRLAHLGIDSATTNLVHVAEEGPHPQFHRPCPVARRIKDHALYLPVNQRLSTRDLSHVARAILAVIPAADGQARR